jgi:hypothetical protein
MGTTGAYPMEEYGVEGGGQYTDTSYAPGAYATGAAPYGGPSAGPGYYEDRGYNAGYRHFCG